MKLRVRDNSIRLRLTQSEVEALRTTRRVAAAATFPGDRRLDYVCEAGTVDAPSASFDGSAVTVTLPASLVEGWADSEEVSISGDQALPDGGALAILVEKDFACLAPREGEDEADMFAHPLAGKDTSPDRS